MSDEKQVIVFESASGQELEMARALLERAGIPCAVRGGSASAYLETVMGSGGAGVQAVVVAPQDQEQALLALKRAWGSGTEGGEGEPT
ncbi:MAG: DUF2007 domain-containing protein [Planctomycetota bacterium]